MKFVLTLFILFISVTLGAEKIVNIFLVGPGNVGSELLSQIENYHHPDLKLRVVALADSKFMHFDPAGIDLKNWKSLLFQPMAFDKFVREMVALKLPESIFVDCTSSQVTTESYPYILKKKISVVTPNKKGNSGSFKNYAMVRRIVKKYQAHFLYDASVGAGLPIIATIKSIKRSGDEIIKLEAILSGTLSYLFNTYDGGIAFSKILKEAQEKGYTEPDPRDDLNGMDMARKFLILARESGLNLEMKDIVVERFLPEECFTAPTIVEFYKSVARFDNDFARKAESAKRKGQVLRFIGTLENGKAILSLKAVTNNHPFYYLSDTDNMAALHTRIYNKNPVVIKGPGSGASITAASILSNIVATTGVE